MGGGGAVVRGEGKFESDTIVVNNIKTNGVLDGLVNLTVQVTDSTSALVATKSAEYLKDVVYPKAYYSRSNIQDTGESNIDEFTVEIVVEDVDVGGTYSYGISNTESSGLALELNSGIKRSSIYQSNDVKYITGSIDSISNTLKNIDFKDFKDGYIKTTLIITDQVGNVGNSEISYYNYKNNKISYVGSTLTDTDEDGVADFEDNCINIFNPNQNDRDNNGIGDICDLNDGFFDNIDYKSENYTKFNDEVRPVYIIETENSVLNFDKNSQGIDLNLLGDLETIEKIKNRVDSLVEFYKNNSAYNPGGGNSKYGNKTDIYFGNPSCGSGCGLVGSKGVEVSGFENIFFNIKYELNVNRDVIIAYELGRNYYGVASKLSFPFAPNTDEKNGGFSEGYAANMVILAYDQILKGAER